MTDKPARFNIKKLREQAEQPKPDDQTTVKPEPDNQMAVKEDNQPEEKRVNLCVKVPESWRKHWAIQAKIQDTTMTEIMVEALTARFGLPDNQ